MVLTCFLFLNLSKHKLILPLTVCSQQWFDWGRAINIRKVQICTTAHITTTLVFFLCVRLSLFVFFDDATVVFNSPFCNDYFLQEKYCSSLKLLIKIDTDGTFLKASKTIIITYGMIRNEFSSRIIIGIILLFLSLLYFRTLCWCCCRGL